MGAETLHKAAERVDEPVHRRVGAGGGRVGRQGGPLLLGIGAQGLLLAGVENLFLDDEGVGGLFLLPQLVLVLLQTDLFQQQPAAGRGWLRFLRFFVCPLRLDAQGAAARHKILPDGFAILAGEVFALHISPLKQPGQLLRRLHPEGRAAGGAHDREGLPPGRLDDLLLLALIDAARVGVELHQVLHIVGRQGKDKAVLTGVDDGRGLAGDLLRPHKVLDVLRNDDLHPVIFTDALGQLEHEVQRDGELVVDKDVGLVDDHHDLPVQAVFCVVIPIFDDLVVDIFEHQQHLGVGDGAVAVGQHGLEVEHREVLVRRDGGRPVPDIGVSPALGELRHIVHQRAQGRAQILVVRALELRHNSLVEIVEGGVVLRAQAAQIAGGGDAPVEIHPVGHVVEVFQRVLVDVRQDLLEKLLQKLQMGGVAAAAFPALVVLQGGDDVERIQPPVLGVAHVDELAVQVRRQLRVLVLRVQNEDLRVLGGQIHQQALGGVGLTGAGFSHDDHIAVHALAVPPEEVDEHGDAAALPQADAALVADMGVDPGIAGRHGVAGDAPAPLGVRVQTADLGANKRGRLVKLHMIEPESGLRPGAPHRFFHVTHDRQQRIRRLIQPQVRPGGGDVVGGDVNVALQQHLVLPLERGQQLLQGGQMLLDFQPLGVHARGAPLSPQLHQRAVDATDGLVPGHLAALEHHLGPRQGHDPRQPRVPHHRRVIHHPEMVGDDVIDLHVTVFDVDHVRHGPGRQVLAAQGVHVMLVEVHLVGVFEEQCKALVVQASYGQFALAQGFQRVAQHHVQLPPVAFEENQVEKLVQHPLLLAEVPQLVDAVILDLDADLVFLLGQKPAFEGAGQLPHLPPLPVQIGVVVDGPLQLDDVGAVLAVDGAQDAPQAGFDGSAAAALAEKAELHRVDLDDTAVVVLPVLDAALPDIGKGDDAVHALAAGALLPCDGGAAHGRDGLRRAFFSDGGLFLGGGALAFENAVLVLSGEDAGLFLRLALPLLLLSLLPGLLRLLGLGHGLPDLLRNGPEGGLVPVSGGAVLEHLVAVKPGESAVVGEVGDDLHDVLIVRRFVDAQQQCAGCQNHADANGHLPRKRGDQHQNDHAEAHRADCHVADGHAAEQLHPHFGFSRYQSVHLPFSPLSTPKSVSFVFLLLLPERFPPDAQP